MGIDLSHNAAGTNDGDGTMDATETRKRIEWETVAQQSVRIIHDRLTAQRFTRDEVAAKMFEMVEGNSQMTVDNTATGVICVKWHAGPGYATEFYYDTKAKRWYFRGDKGYYDVADRFARTCDKGV